MPHSYEVEVKCLLGGKETADVLRAKLKEKDTGLRSLGTNKQLNHYFTGRDLRELLPIFGDRVAAPERERFEEFVRAAKTHSLRSRWVEGEDGVRLVIKASVDSGTSANTVARIEFDSIILGLRSLEELDKLILGAGFHYEAKWSREREEYQYFDMRVTIDKNAGYGYLAEFEIIAADESVIEETKKRLRAMVKELGLEELDAGRLELMFAYYNARWEEYYRTENIFTIQ